MAELTFRRIVPVQAQSQNVFLVGIEACTRRRKLREAPRPPRPPRRSVPVPPIDLLEQTQGTSRFTRRGDDADGGRSFTRRLIPSFIVPAPKFSTRPTGKFPRRRYVRI